MSRYYDQYFKYFLVKHKPWRGSIDNAWGGPITDPESDDPGSILEDYHEITQSEAPHRCRTVCGRGLQRQPSGAKGRPEGRRYYGDHGNGGSGRYVGILPPVPKLMVPGRVDVEHDQGGEGGAVLDGLNYGDGSPSLWKRLA